MFPASILQWASGVRHAMTQVLCCAALCVLCAAPVRAQSNASTVVPGDGALEKQHARIGRIEIRVDDVFEGELGNILFKTANALHLSTRAQIIADQLLFRSGDIYERRVLDETERLLRTQRYLNAASIEPISYNDDNTVDVVVRVHEVWTLSPGLSFGRKGGVSNTRFELEDSKFLGLGKFISLTRADGGERNAWRAAYADPNVFGSRWQSQLSYASLSDGDESSVLLAHPFYSLDSRWSATLAAADSTSRVARYRLGEVDDWIAQRQSVFELGGGVSDGLIDGATRRWLGGYRFQRREFAPTETALHAPLPNDRTFSYVWLGAEWMQDKYLETHNLDQVGRTEDIYIGRLAHVEVGVASTLIGATRDALLLNGTWQSGFSLDDDQFLIGNAAFNTRVEGGSLRNAQADIGVRYYWRHSPGRVTFGAMNATRALKLDADQQLSLGGDNGLRGYPLKYQSGTGRALLTIEERFYTNWQPLKLANVGAAVFADVGRTFGRDPIGGASAGWLTDVGVGLRLGNARSGLGNVLHIDLAVPLNAPSGIDSMQLLIETKRSF